MIQPVLRFSGVGKVFTDHADGTAALADVCFELPPGAFVSLTGPSGSGKSTVLRLAADLLQPTSGQISVCGGPPAAARHARQIGMVFQSPVLLTWRTVLNNVQLPLQVAGVHKAERAARAREVLGLVGLADVADRYPRQLSGGMRQRVALARALVTRPALLLMDEPFAALDELTRERLNLELLRVWQETGVTVLFVTHDIEEAVFLSDSVLVLTQLPGTIATQLPMTLARPRDEATRHSAAYFADVSAVRAALHAAAERVGLNGTLRTIDSA